MLGPPTRHARMSFFFDEKAVFVRACATHPQQRSIQIRKMAICQGATFCPVGKKMIKQGNGMKEEPWPMIRYVFLLAHDRSMSRSRWCEGRSPDCAKYFNLVDRHKRPSSFEHKQKQNRRTWNMSRGRDGGMEGWMGKKDKEKRGHRGRDVEERTRTREEKRARRICIHACMKKRKQKRRGLRSEGKERWRDGHGKGAFG